jgi:hypothetical protein
MSIKFQAIRKAMQQRLSAEERDIPKYVQDKAEFFETEKGYEPGYAFSTAWSIYCKYKNPGDKVHCTKEPSEYFTGKKASSRRYAGAVKSMLMDAISKGIEYLEQVTGLDLNDDVLFDLTQEYIMSSFSSKVEFQLQKLLSSKGVSKNLILKYFNMIQFETQEVPF